MAIRSPGILLEKIKSIQSLLRDVSWEIETVIANDKATAEIETTKDWLVLARNKLEAVVNQEYQHNQTVAHTRASWKVIDGGG